MYQLYHYPICPLSRQIRILLYELNIEFSLIKENFWEKRVGFLALNPSGLVPILVKKNLVVAGIYPIIEYLNENYLVLSFKDYPVATKCEVRRLIEWFNLKFYREVTKIILDEKVIKHFTANYNVRVEFLKIAKNNLIKHLQYISQLLEDSSFIGSEELSYADITASAHFSVLDYFGDINWDLYPQIKNWYSILKSRPSYRSLLQDTVPGIKPSANYSNLDF